MSLLQLPGPCLEAVLRCCADDPRSVCSAARAHSRLHQAAVLAVSSIEVVVKTYPQLNSLVNVYLASHGKHVDSISLNGDEDQPPWSLSQLPATLTKLSSLQLDRFHLHLLPGHGYNGIVEAVAAAGPLLKQLRLDNITLGDEEDGESLAQVLALLPGLGHLCCSGYQRYINDQDVDLAFPGGWVDGWVRGCMGGCVGNGWVGGWVRECVSQCTAYLWVGLGYLGWSTSAAGWTETRG